MRSSEKEQSTEMLCSFLKLWKKLKNDETDDLKRLP